MHGHGADCAGKSATPLARATTDLEKLFQEATLDPDVAFRLVGVSRNTGYKGLRNGDIPSIRIGNLYRIPTAPLRELLNLSIEGARAA